LINPPTTPAPPDIVSGHVGDVRTWLGWPLAQRAMRPMFVVVRGVLAEDGCQVPLAGDRHAVGALPPDGAHPRFRERVRPRRLRRRPDHRDTGRGEYGVEGGGELRVAVAAEPQRVCSLAKIHQQIPRLLGHPRAGGVAGHPDDVDAAGGDLEEAPVYPGVLDELRIAQVVIAGHAFVQDLRRGHYDLGVDARPVLQVAAALTELAKAI
jgi:hypothetical protein